MPFTHSRALVGLGVALALAIGIGASALVGCGGDDATDTNAAVADEKNPDAEGSSDSSQSSSDEVDGKQLDCKEAGISVAPRNEGYCFGEGRKYVVVNKDGTLQLAELEAELVDVRKAKSMSSEDGETKTAKGTYIIFTVDVTNTTEDSAYFDRNQKQVFLAIGGDLFNQDLEVEKTALADSFAIQSEEIQPGETQRGTVAFDVPKAISRNLGKTGNLDVINFSEEGSNDSREMGTIRTYQ